MLLIDSSDLQYSKRDVIEDLHHSSSNQNQKETKEKSPTSVVFFVKWLRSTATWARTPATTNAQSENQIQLNRQ